MTNVDRVVVKITNAESVDEGNDKQFTIYHISMSYKDWNWTISHRFSSLLEMKEKLTQIKKQFPEAHQALPKFPKKKLFGSMNVEVILKRIRKIERYLQSVVDTPRLLQCDEVQGKLYLRNYLNRRSSQGGTSPPVHYDYDALSKDDKEQLQQQHQQQQQPHQSQLQQLLAQQVLSQANNNNHDNYNKAANNLITACIDFLRKRGLDEEYLLYKSAPHSSIQQLLIYFEQQHQQQSPSPITIPADYDVYCVSSVLKYLLENQLYCTQQLCQQHQPSTHSSGKEKEKEKDELVGYLIAPYLGFLAVDDLGSEAEKLHVIFYLVNSMPALQYSTLRYLIHFLSDVIAHNEQNKMDMKKILPIFGPLLMKPTVEDGAFIPTDIQKIQNILRLFIENYTKIF